MPPKYLEYHRSVTAELHAVRDRIKDLVGHRLSSGEHRESALRMMLRRHLPPSLTVGRGFVVTSEDASEQIDVLVVDGSRPCLYRDGDLMIVTPDAVRAIVEVKTKSALTSNNGEASQLTTDVTKLAEKGALCEKVLQQADSAAHVWTGLFIFDSAANPHVALLEGIKIAKQTTNHNVKCIAFGKQSFCRYWSPEEVRDGALSGRHAGAVWHAYQFDEDEDIAPSYFIGNLLDAVSVVDRTESSYAWFPLIGGKETRFAKKMPADTLQIE